MPETDGVVGIDAVEAVDPAPPGAHVIVVGCHAADLDKVQGRGWQVSLISRRGSLARLPDEGRAHFAAIEVLGGPDDGDLGFYEVHDAAVERAAEVLAARLGRPRAVIGLYEHTVLPAARLREHFGLDGLSVDAASLCRDKVRMKRALAADGVPVPRFGELTSEAADVAAARDFFRDGSGPVVVKPRRQAAARGLHIVQSHEELRGLARREDLADYEIEEYVDGDVFHVDAVVRDTRIAWVSAGRYVGSCAAYGAPEASLASVVEHDPALVAAIREFTERVVRSLGITDSVIHLELFHRGPGELVFLEVGCRSAGGPGTPWMYRELFGVDLVEEQVLAATGSATSVAGSSPSAGSGHVGWLMTPAPMPREGRVAAIHGARDLPSAVVGVRTPPLGSTVADSDPVWPHSGVFLLRADSEGELDRAMSEILRTYRVEVAGAADGRRGHVRAG